MAAPHEPRPALKRANDGSVHPASPKVVTQDKDAKHPSGATRNKGTRPLGVADSSNAKRHKRPTSTASSQSYTGKPVKLEVEVPKKLRRAIRAEAESTGTSVDDVVVAAVTSHLHQNT
jgi:hypothetical protein